MKLKNIVIAYETEAATRARLLAYGYAPDIAAEIAVYLGQATDLPEFFDEITTALDLEDLTCEFVELDDVLFRWPQLQARRDETLLWCITDGIRFYRGSAFSALARMDGFARYGSPAPAQHLCQNKFASLALADSAGVQIVPTILMEGSEKITGLGDMAAHTADHPSMFFVKPNTLGAKIGIFADSRCNSLQEATRLSERLWLRYHDRALIQPFIHGDDVRVSFMDTGGSFLSQIGIEQLAKNPASETGGAFMTMKDNETLSGARDTTGNKGGFGASRQAAFVPHMINMRAAADTRSQGAVSQILVGVQNLARLLELKDYFSMDFRVDADGNACFFEFEVCPGITIYDFQNYLQGTHRLSLGAALARSFRLAFARRFDAGEA